MKTRKRVGAVLRVRCVTFYEKSKEKKKKIGGRRAMKLRRMRKGVWRIDGKVVSGKLSSTGGMGKE